jgi:DNA-binding LytR/AlgR family response regulator
MKISICDDLKNELDKLENLCFEYDRNAIISKYSNGQELCSELNDGNKADIIILDIDMPGDDGIKIGKRIRESDSDVIIIFYTSYPQYAVESYDCDAFYYLMKDCSKEKFFTVLKRAYDKLKINRKYIIIQQRKTPRRISISDIYYIECVKKHLNYHIEGEDIEISANLSDAYSELKDFEFYQVHQGYIVNLKKIYKIDDYMIILTNGNKVPISVRKKTEVITRYADFMEKNL